MASKTLTLTYVPARQAFRVAGLYFGPASADEYEDMCEFLGRKLNDNPAAQSALGVLGVGCVRFRRGKAVR